MVTTDVLIMASGTGGHVFPALALAQYYQQQGLTVAWLGTPHGLENRICQQHHITLIKINMLGVRHKGWRRKLLLPLMLMRALWQCHRAIRRIVPKVVVGFGGYVTVPGGIGAWLCRKPLAIHEQNALAGLSNRILARFACQIFLGFPDALSAERSIVSGNPLRDDFYQQPVAYRPHHPLRLLVVGGSLGAHFLNEIVPSALAQITPGNRPLVKHQSGEKNRTIAEQAYARHHVSAEVMPFIYDMLAAYHWADIVIARAGALSVTEIADRHRPAIFVPLPHAVDDHQFHNAQQLVKHGGAVCCRQEDCTPQWLSQQLQQWCDSPTLLQAMSDKLKVLPHQNAITTMAVALQSYLQRSVL